MDTSSVGKMTAGAAFGSNSKELGATSLLPELFHLNGSSSVKALDSKETNQQHKKSALRRFGKELGN
ncbi:MAG: hypothetical protein VKN56_11130 [Cyanobacteriota bacterium]|nr:hypothetical protein [Cyanobacteriota bacterium]